MVGGTGGIPQAEWSEETENNVPNDRRGVGSVGPFNLEPGETVELTLLFGFFRDTVNPTIEDYEDFEDEIVTLINWYENDSIPSNYEDVIVVGIRELNNNPETPEILIFPNPAKDNVTICYLAAHRTLYRILDIHGKIRTTGYLDSYLSHISTNHLSEGIYIVRIIDGDREINRKIVITD